MTNTKNNNTSSSAYDKSKIIHNLIENISLGKAFKIAFVDIDATFTGHPTVTKRARVKFEELGYSLIFVTARTEEMVMSKTNYEKSVKLGFTRPKPRLGMSRGKQVYVDPKIANTNLVDPDIIVGSTGTQILIKQINGGYIIDKSFQISDENYNLWRQQALQFIKRIDPNCTFSKLSPIESEKNYFDRKTDVFPTKYRIKLDFESLESKIAFLEKIESQYITHTSQTMKTVTFKDSKIRFIDDSHPDKNQFTMYLTPVKAYKGRAVEHVVDMICKTLKKKLKRNIVRSDLNVILAGDSYPDLTMLLYGASGTKAVAIVVGGSRLTRVLTHKSLDTYAGENMTSLKRKLQLHISKKGHYNFQTVLEDNVLHVRNVIFGDHAFPLTKGPETILAFLNENLIKN